MLIKSGLVTQGSGSLGGMTMSHNRGGYYLRARTVPTDPASSYQTILRSYMSQLANLWVNELTPAMRAAWDLYAKNVTVLNALGDAISLSGINHYIRSNLPRLQAGLPRVDSGPTTFDLGDFTAPSAVVGTAGAPGTIDVTFDNGDDWANEDDAAMLVFGSRPQNPTINFFKGPYRYADTIDGDSVTPPTSPANLNSAFTLTAAQLLYSLVRVSRADGRLSNPFRTSGDVS